jgi:HK97 gp10 family phage protein
MKMSVKIEGLSDVNTALKKLQKACPEAAKKAILSAALLVEREAKIKTTPNVDTGNLRASITHELTEEMGGNVNGALIGTPDRVFYAPYLEFGTKRNRAYPFLIPALREAVLRIKAFFEAEFKKI